MIKRNTISKFIKMTIFFSELFFAILIWVIIIPIAIIIPKKKNSVVIFGIRRPYFQNLGALYEFIVNNENLEVYYIISKKNKDYKTLKSMNINNITILNIKSIIKLIRASIVVVDSTLPNYIGIFARKAKFIQIWHGNGMKKVGWMSIENKNKIEQLLIKLRSFLLTGVLKYELVYFTSKFSYESRKNSFKFKKFKFNGQPRNDIIFYNNDNFFYNFISELKISEYNKFILYVPTWRESDQLNIYDNIEFNILDDFCRAHDIYVLVKLHPLEKKSSIFISGFKNIILLETNFDIYNILSKIDLLITDYSSIYFDYLLLNKPIIFFCFDKIDYLSNQRDLVYNYDDITPGVKVFNVIELITEIENILIRENDKYITKRIDITKLFYEYVDNKSRIRIENDILELIKLDKVKNNK